jgi:hypothetical protein
MRLIISSSDCSSSEIFFLDKKENKNDILQLLKDTELKCINDIKRKKIEFL